MTLLNMKLHGHFWIWFVSRPTRTAPAPINQFDGNYGVQKRHKRTAAIVRRRRGPWTRIKPRQRPDRETIERRREWIRFSNFRYVCWERGVWSYYYNDKLQTWPIWGAVEIIWATCSPGSHSWEGAKIVNDDKGCDIHVVDCVEKQWVMGFTRKDFIYVRTQIILYGNEKRSCDRPFMYESFVMNVEPHMTMDVLIDGKWTFNNFRCARYTTNVTFQQSYWPSDRIQKDKRYVSGKKNIFI